MNHYEVILGRPMGDTSMLSFDAAWTGEAIDRIRDFYAAAFGHRGGRVHVAMSPNHDRTIWSGAVYQNQVKVASFRVGTEPVKLVTPRPVGARSRRARLTLVRAS